LETVIFRTAVRQNLVQAAGRGPWWVGLLLVFAMDASPASAGGEPCKLATKGDSVVAKACREGGIPKAKAVMKDLVSRGKKKSGKDLGCKTCHDGIEDSRYDLLRKDARERFKELLATLQ
jgi:hypothetical protein